MIGAELRTFVVMTTISKALFATDNFARIWKLADTKNRPSQTEVWQPTRDGYKITVTG